MSLPGFENLAATGTLQIPLSLRPAAVEGVLLREHLSLEPRDPLSSGAVENAHLALAPAKGVCGTLGEVQLTSGHLVAAIPFQLSGAFVPSMKPIETSDNVAESLRDLNAQTLAAWIESFRNAGIHAHRTGSPGFLEQLLQAVKRPIDVVLGSILDSDPNAPLQSLLAATFPIEFATGIAAIGKLTNARRTAAAMGSMPSRWLQRFRKHLDELKIAAISLNGDYPLSDPTLLLYATLNRKLRPFRLPTELGVIVLDVATAVAIGRFLLQGEVQSSVPVALHDWRSRRTRYLIAPIGVAVADILRHFPIGPVPVTLRGGDSLRDVRITPQTVIAGSELVIHLSQEEPAINPDPCIRCGWCVEVCPTGVQPAGVLEAAQRGDRDLAERMGIEACIECGLCSFVCPAKLPLLGGIRGMKGS